MTIDILVSEESSYFFDDQGPSMFHLDVMNKSVVTSLKVSVFYMGQCYTLFWVRMKTIHLGKYTYSNFGSNCLDDKPHVI